MTNDDLRAYQEAFDSTPWATDEPARVQLAKVTERLVAGGGLSLALQDCLSTFRHDGKTSLVSAERQEAWADALKTWTDLNR